MTLRLTRSFVHSNYYHRALAPMRELSSFSAEKKPSLFQHHRGVWPLADYVASVSSPPPLPQRTVKLEDMKFNYKSSFVPGSMIFYPHFKVNPTDMKVRMQVSIDDLGLNEKELNVFRVLVGPRINIGKRILTLTCEMFTNRVENRKYLIYQLETLLQEARKLAKEV